MSAPSSSATAPKEWGPAMNDNTRTAMDDNGCFIWLLLNLSVRKVSIESAAYRQHQQVADGFENVVETRSFNDMDIDICQLSRRKMRPRGEKNDSSGRIKGSDLLRKLCPCHIR